MEEGKRVEDNSDARNEDNSDADKSVIDVVAISDDSAERVIDEGGGEIVEVTYELLFPDEDNIPRSETLQSSPCNKEWTEDNQVALKRAHDKHGYLKKRFLAIKRDEEFKDTLSGWSNYELASIWNSTKHLYPFPVVSPLLCKGDSQIHISQKIHRLIENVEANGNDQPLPDAITRISNSEVHNPGEVAVTDFFSSLLKLTPNSAGFGEFCSILNYNEEEFQKIKDRIDHVHSMSSDTATATAVKESLAIILADFCNRVIESLVVRPFHTLKKEKIKLSSLSKDQLMSLGSKIGGDLKIVRDLVHRLPSSSDI
ncbi:hypothetical protein MKW92_023926 [Papaver armeniacum]|nr:hypothetical protein MKW92_023926 [Papaver armeniacum]